MSAYEPRPGTVAFKLLAHIELLHKGSEITSSLLAAACGIDPNSVGPQLQPAVKAGLIFSRQKGGHPKSPRFWSLVDHSAKTPEGQGSQLVLKAEPAKADATDRDAPAVASPGVGPMGADQAADAAVAVAPPPVKAVRKPSKPKAKPEAVPSVRQYIEAIERSVPSDADEGILVGGAVPTRPYVPELRVALWSDGTLEVRRSPDDLVLFTRAEARAIVDYLNAIDLEVLEE